MQSAIRRGVQTRVKQALPLAEGEAGSEALRSLHGDLRSLEETIANTDLQRFAAAVEALDSAAFIHVCGFRTSYSLAYLAEFHIRQVRRSVRLIDAGGGTHADDLALIDPADSVLAFTFPVYDDRTIATIEHAANTGAAAVVVTDSALAPLPISGKVHPLIVRPGGRSFFNSTVSAAALVNAIVVRLVELRTARDPSFGPKLTRRFQHERSRHR
jgi:DNA-binding MurR/RpiR family transcriptional regulator